MVVDCDTPVMATTLVCVPIFTYEIVCVLECLLLQIQSIQRGAPLGNQLALTVKTAGDTNVMRAQRKLSSDQSLPLQEGHAPIALAGWNEKKQMKKTFVGTVFCVVCVFHSHQLDSTYIYVLTTVYLLCKIVGYQISVSKRTY